MTEFERHHLRLKDDRHLSYLAAGPEAGPLMIFCHGWPAISITWKPQLTSFAASGFRVVAPDMPGYGDSSVTKKVEDYCLESINEAMLELLKSFGRDAAIWVGHDYGAVAVWSFAAHFPEKTSAVICLARPYHTLELGLEEVLPTINRTIYPAGKYPYGQYDYQVYFQQSFETATTWFDKDPEAVIRGVYARGHAEEVGKPSITSTVTRDGGWFGGAPEPPAMLRKIPFERLCIDEAMFQEVLAAFKKNGFWAPDAWYANHGRNRAYSLEKWKNDGYLHMPVLFIGANWDPISDITVSRIADAGKKFCTNLTEKALDAGHWVALEKPEEVNEIMTKWLDGMGFVTVQ